MLICGDVYLCVNRLIMNEFTKEELMQLRHLVSSVPIDDVLLLRKIQSIIEHYCDHQSLVSFHEQFRWQQCSKCGEVYK